MLDHISKQSSTTLFFNKSIQKNISHHKFNNQYKKILNLIFYHTINNEIFEIFCKKIFQIVLDVF